jgi:hypothetical protein
MVLLVFQFPVLQEHIGMELFAQPQILIAQLVLTGKDLLVLQLPINALLGLHGTVKYALQIILSAPSGHIGTESLANLSNLYVLLE